jgi:hypothetical protein
MVFALPAIKKIRMPNAHSYLDKGFPGFSLGFRVEASLLLQAKKYH